MAVRGGLELVTIGILLTQVGLILSVQLLPREGVDVAAFQALMLVLALSGLAAGAVLPSTDAPRHNYVCIRILSLMSHGLVPSASSPR